MYVHRHARLFVISAIALCVVEFQLKLKSPAVGLSFGGNFSDAADEGTAFHIWVPTITNYKAHIKGKPVGLHVLCVIFARACLCVIKFQTRAHVWL